MSDPPLTQSADGRSDLRLTSPIPLTRHPAIVYLNSLSAGSQPTMRGSLNAIASLLCPDCDAMTLNWAALRYQHTAAVRATLSERYSPSTANKMLSALKRVLLEARKLELMSEKDYKLAIDLRPVPVTQGLRGRALSRSEIGALLRVCLAEESPRGIRDAALIAFLRGSGVRRRELVNLDLADLDQQTGAIGLTKTKGGKSRTVYLPPGVLSALLRWLAVRGTAPGPLFCPISRGQRVLFRRLTSPAVLFILRERGRMAGVAPFSTHDFRRTFISDLLDAGVDIVTVQRLAGHNDPATTSRYDRRGEATLRRAVEFLDLPGLGEGF